MKDSVQIMDSAVRDHAVAALASAEALMVTPSWRGLMAGRV